MKNSTVVCALVGAIALAGTCSNRVEAQSVTIEEKQITDLKPREFVPLLLMGAQAYKESKYADLAGKIEGRSVDLDALILRDGLGTKGSK